MALGNQGFGLNWSFGTLTRRIDCLRYSLLSFSVFSVAHLGHLICTPWGSTKKNWDGGFWFWFPPCVVGCFESAPPTQIARPWFCLRASISKGGCPEECQEKGRRWADGKRCSIRKIIGIAVFAICIWLKSDEAFYRWVEDLQIYQFYIGIYIILFGSCIIILTSCLSCLFIANENINGMKIMIIVYLVKYLCGLIGAALLLNYSTNNSAIQPLIRQSMLSLIAQSQNDTRAHTLKLIQESIGCCGADGANDYLESKKALPPECRDSVTGHTHFHGCVDELTWFLEEKAMWLSGAAMFLCFFDVLKAVFTAVLIKAVREADKGSY